MAQQASWIRENMFPSQQSHLHKFNIDNKQYNYRRPLTEAEIKVQRSLEKLSIPSWYLNNSSKPPKILMHNTPIDARQPSWKTGTYKNKNVSSSPILNERKLSGTASPQKTPTIDRKPEEKRVTRIINRMDTWQIHSPAKSPVKYTRSFPKVSPSRKIHNINIVFPSSSNIDQDQVNEYEINNNSELLVENSMYESSLNESYCEKSVKVTNLDKVFESSMEQSFNIQDAVKLYNPTTSKHHERCLTPVQSSPPLIKERVKITSIPKYSTVSLSSIIDDNTSQIEHKQQLQQQQSTTMSSISPQDDEEICDDCKTQLNNSYDGSPFRYLPGSTDFKSRSKLMPIDEDKEINQRTRSTPVASSKAFMTATKKSTVLEQIVKRKMVSGTGLIQEIIQEFQNKCRKTSNPIFTRGSKKFVKKLVKVLEKSIHEESETTQTEEKVHGKLENFVLSNNNVNINELDNKSVTSSATISLKGSDNGSGSSEPPSPTSSASPDYNWNMQVQTDIRNKIKKSSTNKENKVHWIPLPSEMDLPRTSSALSMKSRSSSRSSSNKSPCISPITEDNEHQHFFSNNKELSRWSYGRNNIINRRRLSDSGYADKTEHSFMIQSFLAEYEASQSASELDTSANRRLSLSRASSILTRPVRV